MSQGIYAVEVVVKEMRTYLVEASSQAEAEDLAIEAVENGEEPKSTDYFDGNPYVHDSRDVSEDYRDHEAS
jgi:hypothetical protein